MAEEQRMGGLEMEQDLTFQRWEWRFQKVGIIVLMLIVAAGMLGLLGGDGPLSAAVVSSERDLLRLEYDRYEQFMNWTEMRIYPQQSDFTLWIDRDFAEILNIDHMNPEADSAGTSPNKLLYTFEDFEPGEPITLYYRFSRFGIFEAQMGIVGGPTLTFTQVVYP